MTVPPDARTLHVRDRRPCYLEIYIDGRRVFQGPSLGLLGWLALARHPWQAVTFEDAPFTSTELLTNHS